MFTPESIGLEEAGPGDPYGWLLVEDLTWSGAFHGSDRRLEVHASPEHPFSTDLASVPRSLTWLFPRYGRYTKAAVLHDYVCQNFRNPPTGAVARSLLPLTDRSDADEMFQLVMQELGVPWLRRRLMWAAVSWATMITSLVPGRASKPVRRRVGRIVVVAGLVALAVALVVGRDLTTLVVALAAVPTIVLVGGTLALGRADRVVAYLLAYLLTLVFSPLLVLGLVLAVVLYLYFFVEDVFAGLPQTRRFLRDLFSPAAKLEKVGTPQFARLAAVMRS